MVDADSKESDVRRNLKPLKPLERPRAVTVAAVVAILLAISMIVPFLVKMDVVEEMKLTTALPVVVLLLVASAGMWKAKYWAVLGFQAYLALLILTLSLFLLRAGTWYAALLSTVLIVACGVLFWWLVKAMARIQMPRR